MPAGEYAARAGTTGDRYGRLDMIAWYKDNSGGSTHPVEGLSAVLLQRSLSRCMIRNWPLSGHIGELPAAVATMNRYLTEMGHDA